METKRQTEEVMTALQNMPSLGEELVPEVKAKERERGRTKSLYYDIARRTIEAIKQPSENRKGSEQLEHTKTKDTYSQGQVKNESRKSSIKRSYQPLNPRRKRLWQSW